MISGNIFFLNSGGKYGEWAGEKFWANFNPDKIHIFNSQPELFGEKSYLNLSSYQILIKVDCKKYKIEFLDPEQR